MNATPRNSSITQGQSTSHRHSQSQACRGSSGIGVRSDPPHLCAWWLTLPHWLPWLFSKKIVPLIPEQKCPKWTGNLMCCFCWYLLCKWPALVTPKRHGDRGNSTSGASRAGVGVFSRPRQLSTHTVLISRSLVCSCVIKGWERPQ